MQRVQLPPGQQLAAPGKWPLVGERVPGGEAVERAGCWTVEVRGLVGRTRTWTLDELRCGPVEERVIDIHCVTRWSMLGTRWHGVPLRWLLDQVEPASSARFLSCISCSPRRHSTSLPLADLSGLDPLLAWSWQGEPIPSAHGGPLRMVVPGRYFYKSIKWLTSLELLAEDRLGFWEETAGYHNGADPWREQRFVASDMTRAEAGRLLASRDLSGRTLRGLDASGRELTGLRAAQAVLRDADFSGCQLQGADFRGANLSGSRFFRAQLCGATFAAADLEGVDFRGADLRGADFRDASLLGVSFRDGPETPSEQSRGSATCDAETRFDASAAEQLTPAQADWLPHAGWGGNDG